MTEIEYLFKQGEKGAQEVLSEILIPREALEKSPLPAGGNAIEQKTVIVVGRQGSGKSQTAEWLAGKIKGYYGNDCSVVAMKGDLQTLLTYGLRDVFVNVIICEDMTRVKQSDEAINNFFRVRHLIKERFGRTRGYVIAIGVIHRIFGTNIELRSDVSLHIFKNSPTNRYDNTYIRGYIGRENLSILEDIQSQTAVRPELKGFSAYFISDSKRGLMYNPHMEVSVSDRLVPIRARPSFNPLKALVNLAVVFPCRVVMVGSLVAIAYYLATGVFYFIFG